MKELWTPSRKLHLPPPTMIGFLLETGAWDAKGKLFHQERILSRSPLKQLLQLLLVQFSTATQDVYDITGVERAGAIASAQILNANAGIADALRGCVIGTGNTPVDITDKKLVTQIAHGSGATQMIYNAVVFDATVTVSDPDCTFDMWRNFNNNSGGSITVKETGIYAQFMVGASPYQACLVRDVPAEIVVPDGGGCYVKYTPKITE
ncbi:hypothetical protein ES705_36217 [subsurface metagenome]